MLWGMLGLCCKRPEELFEMKLSEAILYILKRLHDAVW
jgi:hypothetical protein